MATITASALDLETKICPVCGIGYAVPRIWIERKQIDGGNWFCPAGHSLVFTETEADKLRKKLGKEQETTAWYRQALRDANQEKEQIERSRAAIKGQLTKVKNRVANGVCPCCNRTFANLARHMASQHPDFTDNRSGHD